MADYSANSWNEQDSANTNATPNGIPTGSPPNSLAPTLRTMMGASTRFWRRINAFYTSTGIATAIALSFAQAPTSYVTGERLAFRAHVTNTGPITLNINNLGTKPVLASDGSALTGGEIATGQFIEVWYDGTNFRLIGASKNPSFTNVAISTAATIAGNVVWHAGNDGAGSTLDADLLDGQQGTWYQSRANHTGTQDVATISGLQALLDAIVPASTVIYVAQATAPTGYLVAAGQAVSRSTYARLFDAIGTTYGGGDGTTTFNVPDLRGTFVRGLDSGRGIDVDRALGSVQTSQNLAHNHPITDPGHAHGVYDPGHSHGFWISGGSQNGNFVYPAETRFSTYRTSPTTTSTTGIGIYAAATGITIQNNGGSEARPHNVALLACIKV